ncbi:MAG: hypothetical protein HQ541_12870 [Mariniphaga sp.]|nr:hypothetical protein [Mariniphaga sp.]
MYEQGELINRAGGLSEDMIQQNRQLQSDIFSIILRENELDTAIEKLKYVYSRGMYDVLNDEQKKLISQRIEAVNTPWFKFFLAYDPYLALTKVQCPVLALIGDKDLQVPSKANLEAIEKALTEGGNKNFKIQELKNLNHLFQNCETGAVSEYGQIEETIDPEALRLITNWISEMVK